MHKTELTRRSALSAITAAAACAPAPTAPAYEGALTFGHGVASGDPGPDRVIVWTRVTPERAGPVPVRWIVARNAELSDVVATGVFETNAARDYTVKIDVTGLRAGAPYFYGFRAGNQRSPIGRTRTLPEAGLDSFKIAVASCASYPHGYFNAYQAIADKHPDLVVHLGDYIYEYGVAGYGGDVGMALGRVPQPNVECITLTDYRLRHAQAKGEAELQAAHAGAPWIVVWDDHEVANDDWSGGAENHQPNEGDWTARKRAALQAYYEWMPIREPVPGRAFEAINRSFSFGNLFTLIMVETRLLARTQQFVYERDMPMAGGRPDLAALQTMLNDPSRTLLGPAQEAWLAEQLSASKRAGVTWQLLGNQVVMAPVTAPDLSATPAALAQQLERLRPGVSRLLALTRFPIPLNPDAWDGYPQARARVLAMMRQAGGNSIVLSGDSHAAWANELNDAQGRVAVELAGTSITSPSDASYFVRAGVDFAALLRARNPQIKWTDQRNRGFIVLSLTKTRALAEYFTVSTITSKQYQVARAAAFSIAPSNTAGIGPLVEAS